MNRPGRSGKGSAPPFGGGGAKPVGRRFRLPAVLTLIGVLAAPAWASLFWDVPSGHLRADDISYVSEQGWFRGYEDRSFRPDEQITPEQMLKTIVRMTPSGMTRAEFASFLRGGHERRTQPPTTYSVPSTLPPPPPPVVGFGGWRPAGGWPQPGWCPHRTEVCIDLPVGGNPPPGLEVGYRVINTTNCFLSECPELVWSPPRSAGGTRVKTPIPRRSSGGWSMLVSVYYQVGSYVMTEWRSVVSAASPGVRCPDGNDGWPLPFCYPAEQIYTLDVCPFDPKVYQADACRNDELTGWSWRR